VDLAVSRWQSDGQDVLFVRDARTEQEVGRYDRRSGRLSVGDQARGYEVVQALWAYLGSPAGAAVHARAARVEEPRPAHCPDDIDGHLLGLRSAAPAPEPAGARARGGRVVDRRLGRLRRDGWAVLSSVGTSTGADFDRLVIGPPGVFTITVRSGNDIPSPHFHDNLHHSRTDAESAARRLSAASGMAVRVIPMLAFAGDGAQPVRTAHYGRGPDEEDGELLVARAEELDDVLRELPAVYSLQERQQILDVARRAELWLD
jgi:hypothetical protein